MELLSASRGFLKCNFHCHTTCSDGRLSPKDVMAAYRALDYDVLAITDHRKVTRPAADEIPAGLMLIPGIQDRGSGNASSSHHRVLRDIHREYRARGQSGKLGRCDRPVGQSCLPVAGTTD